MNIFVGNLSFKATEGDVKKLFEGYGNVASVVIVMEKEKKAPKSRGFGFAQMPDEQQALAAIGALNGKEFMGRVLNVSPARPKGHPAVGGAIAKAKTEAHRDSKLKKVQPKFEAKTEEYPQREGEREKTWFSPVFNKPGTYRGGRRTRSYMSRRGLDGMQEEAKPRRRSQDNPMRWRKKKDKPARRKSDGSIKPWKKPAGDAKPYNKSNGRPQKSRLRKLSVLMIALVFLSGCATYKFQKGSLPYDKGYVVSRQGRTIVEYTLGKDNSVPDDLDFARKRFGRRRAVVEHYYKKMGYVENRFKETVWNPVTMFVKFIPSVFRLPSVAMSDYKYEHDPEYREKIRKQEDQQELAERQRINKLKADLNEYIQDDLAGEPPF